MSPGERYTVYRKIRTADKEELFKRYGTQYYLVGVVELTRQQKNFMLATVVHSFREMRIGDLLIPYEPRSPKIVISSPPKNIQGSIVLGEEHQSIIGTNHVVFVDKGLKNGVRPGQAYSVFLQETGKTDPKSNKEILLLPVVYASLMVLHAEETTATCVVTKALKNISPGATWGTVEP